MTRIKKRSLALLIAVLMMAMPIFSACNTGDTPTDDTESATVSDSESAESTETEAPAPEKLILAENGEYLYRIIYLRRQNNGEKDAAESLANSMKSVFGSNPKTATDVVEYDAAALEIYVGLLAYEESAAAHKALGYGDYSITHVGTKIIIAAYESNVLKTAVNAFISSMKSVSDKDTLMLPENFEVTKTANQVLSALPKVDKAPKMYCIADSSSYTFVLEDCDDGIFDEYKAALAKKEFKEYAAQKLADNSFATYHSELCVVNLAYYPENEAFHVSVDSK